MNLIRDLAGCDHHSLSADIGQIPVPPAPFPPCLSPTPDNDIHPSPSSPSSVPRSLSLDFHTCPACNSNNIYMYM